MSGPIGRTWVAATRRPVAGFVCKAVGVVDSMRRRVVELDFGLVVRDGDDRAITVISLSATADGIDRLWIEEEDET